MGLWRGLRVICQSEDQIKGRRKPKPGHGKQLFHNPFSSDLSTIRLVVYLEQWPSRLVIRGFVQLLWPDPLASEVVDRVSPIPRTHVAVIRLAGCPLRLEGDLAVRITALRWRLVGDWAYGPRVDLVSPGLFDTFGEDLSNQRVVVATVEVALDLGGERSVPFARGGFDGPVDETRIPQ